MGDVNDEIERTLKKVGRRTLRMRLSTLKDFLTEDGKEYRIGICGIVLVAVLLSGAAWAFCWATTLPDGAKIGIALLANAIFTAIATGLIWAVLE